MKDILKSIPKFMYVIFVVLILIIILICIPFESFEKKSDNSVNNEYQVQEDNSGDIDSINDKIKEDNEELGVDGEEVSAEDDSEIKYDFDYGSAEVSNSVLEDLNKINLNELSFEYTDYGVATDIVSGVGADIEKVKSIMIEQNSKYMLQFMDLVFVKKLDDYTNVFKLNAECNELIIVRNMSDSVDISERVVDQGDICVRSLFIGNLSVQEVDGIEVLVGTYEY